MDSCGFWSRISLRPLGSVGCGTNISCKIYEITITVSPFDSGLTASFADVRNCYFIMVVISAVITNVNMFSSDPTAALDISTGQQIINGLIVGIPGYFVYALFAAGLTAAYVEIKTMNGGVETVGDVFTSYQLAL